ncbi:MAG TPA: hypothetical protein VI037_04990 [Nitrososphaera sp.]|jgi:hypothetical protein
MSKLPKNNIQPKSFTTVSALSISAIGMIMVLGFSTTAPLGIAFAQTDNATMTGTTTTTTTASSNPSRMMGVIASMQLDQNGNPAWITAGHWNLESDAPLVGASSNNQTEPHISNFSATLYMVKNADGRDFHQHQVSNFKQESVTHEAGNSTTVNGTFTITLQQGPVDNVRGYIHIVNDKVEFWVDPTTTENHFGPTTITGVVLSPERFSEMMGQQ